jgi:hypothetical protein
MQGHLDTYIHSPEPKWLTPSLCQVKRLGRGRNTVDKTKSQTSPQKARALRCPHFCSNLNLLSLTPTPTAALVPWLDWAGQGLQLY